MNLKQQVKINKKIIILLLFLNFLIIGVSYSYALFEISIIKDNIVIIKTGSIDIITEVEEYSNNTITLDSGEIKKITVNLTNDLNRVIAYKMYYKIINGNSTFEVMTTEEFKDNVVEDVMCTYKTIVFTLINTGSQSITIELGSQGGLVGYQIELKEGIELISKPANFQDEMTYKIKKTMSSSCNTMVEENGIRYISGTIDCINFNYVWYSGKLWRVTAIYPDGSIKLITEKLMTTIEWGANTTYSTSYIHEWLNQEFLPTLYNYENIIVEDAGWYSIENSSSTPIEPTGDYTLTSPVGLLNSYEYYKAYENASISTNWLRTKRNWYLITPYNTSNVTLVYNSGEIVNRDPDEYARGVRPVIVLKPTVRLNGGDGSYNNPYTIKEDNLEVQNNITLLNTRQSGEYVKFGTDANNDIYRIVGTELVDNKLTTKLVLNSYYKNSTSRIKKYFADDLVYGGGTGTEEYWDYYLNNTFLNTLDNNMLEKGTYYTTPYNLNEGTGYKKVVCTAVSSSKSISDCIREGNVVSTKWVGYVGFLRYGEIFSSLNINDYNGEYTTSFYLINNTIFGGTLMIINTANNLNLISETEPQAARPTINLTSTIVIKSGKGTELDPFVIGLPN